MAALFTFLQSDLVFSSYLDNSPVLADKLAIASLMRVSASFEIEVTPGTNGYIPKGNYYFKYASFLPLGSNPEVNPASTGGAVPKAYVCYNYDSSHILNTWYPLNFVGEEVQKQGVWSIMFKAVPFTNNQMVIHCQGLVFLEQDCNNYITPQAINQRKLLYSHINNSTILNKGAVSSVYTESRVIRIAMYVIGTAESTTKAENWLLATASRNANFRFYNELPSDLPFYSIHNILIRDKSNPAQVVSAINVHEEQHIEFTLLLSSNYFQAGSMYAMFSIIRDKSNNNSVRAESNYKTGTIIVHNEASETTFLNPSFYGGNNVVPSFISDPKPFMGVSQKLQPTLNPNEYNAFCDVDVSYFVPGTSYRIIVTVYYRPTPPAPGNGYHSISFITDSILAGGNPKPVPPFCGAWLTDYINTFNNYLEVTPQERIRSVCLWRWSNFFNAKNISLPEIANTITILVYSQDGDYDHILESYSLGKNGLNQFISSYENITVINDLPNKEIRIHYDFRVRYEENRQNLYTKNRLNGSITPLPQSTQNWTGKDIYIEYRLLLNFPEGYQEEYVKIQKIKVLEYDTTVLNLEITTLDGLPLKQLCSYIPKFKVCATCLINDDDININPSDPIYKDFFIGLVDKDVYSISNIKEQESFYGILPQKSDPIISSIDSQFDLVNGGKACAIINSGALTTDTFYRFVAIKKKPIKEVPLCGSDEISSGQGTFYNTINIGKISGYVIILYNMFSQADGLRVIYFDNMIFATGQPNPLEPPLINDNFPTPLQVPGYGAFAFKHDYESGFPTTIDLLMYAPVSGTVWRRSVICPNPPISVNTIYTNAMTQYGSGAYKGYILEIPPRDTPYTISLTFTNTAIISRVYAFDQLDNNAGHGTPLFLQLNPTVTTYNFSYNNNNETRILNGIIFFMEGSSFGFQVNFT